MPKLTKEPSPGMLTQHKGRKHYSLWFVDMEGKEEFVTIIMAYPQAVELYRAMEARRYHKTNQTISDFHLDFNRPYTYAETLDYIAAKMEVEQ